MINNFFFVFTSNDACSFSHAVCAGVLWLCIVAETLYLTLLFAGGALMTLEQCHCFSVMNKLKLSAFAAMCTALSGEEWTLLGGGDNENEGPPGYWVTLPNTS